MAEPLLAQDSDLEHLNYAELLEERAAIQIRIRDLVAAKKTPGNYADPRYRRWRSNAQAEHTNLANRLDLVKLHLARRQQDAARGRRPAGETLPPEQFAELNERRAKLKADLAAAGPDALLVRCRRLIHHLLDDRSPDEAGLSDADRDTFHDLLVYLRMRYGSTPAKEALHMEGG